MTAVTNPVGILPKTSDSGPQGVSKSTNGTAVGSASDKILQAAQDFEAVFLRQMLSALERTTKVGDKGPNVPGQQAYGSMIVDTVANAIAQSGGIGLSQVLAKALTARVAATEEGTTAASASRSNSAGTGKIVAPNDITTNSAQGLSHDAVPITEIRTSASQRMGQLADRRIR
ncbi:MAG TPA: hypothetical protein VIV60_10750 [Polyangiaceae bacterium]